MDNTKIFGLAMMVYLFAAVVYLIYGVSKNKKIGLAGTALALVGFLLNTAAIGIRWAASYKAGFGYVPLSNMYESMVFFSWSIMLIYLVFEYIYGYKVIGIGASLLAFLGIATVSLNPAISSELQPLVPALQSNWLTAHVVTCFVGYAAFAVSFAISIMYLFRSDKEGAESMLPPRKVLDELSYKAVAVGFPLLTLGILTGAAWANYAWGTYWSWDPKETWSLITWFVYAAYLHARFTAGWRGKPLALLSVIGFAAVIFTYWGVNFWLSGLHSYGS